MTDKPTPTDTDLFALIKEHFGLDQRRSDTVIDRRTGRFHDAQRYRDFAAAMALLAKWGQPAPAAEPVAWAFKYDDGTWHDPSTTEHSSGMHPLFAAPQPVAREPLTDGQIQDLLLCGNPTDEEMRLIRIGWDAANGIKGGQHGTE